MRFCLFLFVAFMFSTFVAPVANAEVFCGPTRDECWLGSSASSSSPSYPSTSSRIHINPSAVPTDRGLGIEALTYKSQWDFSLTRGTGRVGAALSLSNAEESFFGPPGFEPADEYLKRRIDSDKYKSQKVNLATAFTLYKNKRSGLKQVQLNLGVMGKYNRKTGTIWPGAGVTAILGGITLGYSLSNDEYLIEDQTLGLEQKLRYSTETHSIGLNLSSFVFDYSRLRTKPENMEALTVSVFTASLMLRRWILTYAFRSEDSERPFYNETLQTLEPRRIKEEHFAGAQFSITKHIMVNAFYNYYRLKEVSLGAVLFF